MTNTTPLVLKFEDWPQADRSAWESLFATGDMFDDAGPCQSWSDGSRKMHNQGYGQWLSFLLRHTPSTLTASPVSRVCEQNIRAFIAECDTRLKPRSVANLILSLYFVALNFDPDEDWAWLLRVSNRLLAKANAQTLPAPHPITAEEIFEWSLNRMAEVEANPPKSARRAASHFRQALMIGFLIARPVRRRSLLLMQVGAHIQTTKDGFHLHFREEDMKDKQARDFSLPSALVAPMQNYLTHHRPVLLGGGKSISLWISQYGDPITPDGLSRELPKVTKRHLGVALRPHAFRHVAATSIAEIDPEHVNIIKDTLGHATLEMAEKHYNRATGISACTDLQSIVSGIRNGKSVSRQ